MNRQIVHLFALFTLLFGLLVGFTSRWTVLEADSLEQSSANRRTLLAEQRVPRGMILARDGRTRIATSERIGSGEAARFQRSYPPGALFSHPVGYSFVQRGRAGLEKSKNDELTGDRNEFSSIVDQLSGGVAQGDDLITTLDAKAQRTAVQGLGGRKGSVVAIEPRTGRVRVMVSVPQFDPNDVPERYGSLNSDDENAPLLNRATQGRYPPGSTMKVVTAAAAIDSGRFKPDSVLDGGSPREIGGAELENFGGQDYGPITLTEALTNSVNTVWGQVGERLGKATMYEYMQRFGFNREPPLDYPPEQLSPSGVFARGRLLDEQAGVDIGRVAIGQERLQVAPLQMAMVAATLANDGTLMEPRLADRVVARDGRVRERFEPAKATEVVKPETARQVGRMMASVVKEGSGTAAALEGVAVAGKTGTAEVDGRTSNQAWFIAFAPVERPRMAIAVTVERTQGFGGTVAAPIAKSVLQDLL